MARAEELPVAHSTWDTQTADGCFIGCPLTYRDIQTVKAVFKEKLRTIYHTRISYPELKQN